MQTDVAQRFIEALHKLEDNHDVEVIVAMYADDARMGNVLSGDQFTGLEGARQFWTKYRDAFGDVHSEFRNIIVTDNRAALEWVTSGTGPDSKPFTYEGVSILEIAGDKLTRFHAFFDSASLGHQLQPAGPLHSKAVSNG